MSEPPLPSGQLRGLCYALADTRNGLTGGEIGRLLAECGIDDPGASTKSDRLYSALSEEQRWSKTSNKVFAFVEASLNPARYTHRPEFYSELRDSTNKVLSFAGYFVGEDGKTRRMAPAKTIDEAIESASGLMTELVRRRIHPAVIKSCRTELMQEDYIHAVLEAAKGMAEALRAKSGTTEDGWELVDYALAGNRREIPRLAINKLDSDTDWAEHRGLASLLKGVFSLFRNPSAHTPRLKYVLSETDALDALSLISMLHRRIEELVPTTPKPPPT